MTFDHLPTLHAVPTITAAQMAEVDRLCATEFAIGTDVLMENAARQVAAAARAFLGGRVVDKRIAALVGPGNNGGDAAGAARHLVNWGANVFVLVAAEQDRLHDATRLELNRLLVATTQRSALVKYAARMPAVEISNADLVLDGLLGFSAMGAPRGTVLDLIVAANRSTVPKLAVDIPSGLDADTGSAPGEIVHAAATVTLGLPKTGLLASEAKGFVGALLLADIGIPHLAFERLGVDTRGLFKDGDLVRVIG